MTESAQLLKIVAHPLCDEARAFNLKGLPKLQLRFQAGDGEVEKRVGQARGLVGLGGRGVLA